MPGAHCAPALEKGLATVGATSSWGGQWGALQICAGFSSLSQGPEVLPHSWLCPDCYPLEEALQTYVSLVMAFPSPSPPPSPPVERLNNIYIVRAAEHGGPVYRAQLHQTGGGSEQGTGLAARVFPYPAHPLLGPPQD